MTDQEVREAEERAAKATPGPWANDNGPWYAELRNNSLSSLGTFRERQDCTFCAHARTDIPKLCKEVRELQQGLMNREETIFELKEEVWRLRADLQAVIEKRDR